MKFLSSSELLFKKLIWVVGVEIWGLGLLIFWMVLLGEIVDVDIQLFFSMMLYGSLVWAGGAWWRDYLALNCS